MEVITYQLSAEPLGCAHLIHSIQALLRISSAIKDNHHIFSKG